MDFIWIDETSGELFESEYLHGLAFSQLNPRVSFGCFPPELHRDRIVAFGCDHKKVQDSVVQAIAGATQATILVHLSNENTIHDSRYYRDVKFVFRSCYSPLHAFRNVAAIPLGYQSGFHDAAQSVDRPAERRFAWAFMGQARPNRKKMFLALGSMPSFQHKIAEWMTGDVLSVAKMCEVYSQTIFAPCPIGIIHPDSFRIMEALENGCIPVVVRFYGYDIFKYTFGDHPFIIGRNWTGCARQMQKLLDDEAALAERAREVNSWYESFKRELASDVAICCATGSTRECSGRQFVYQRRGARDVILRAIFVWHFRIRPKAQHYLNRIRGILGSWIARAGSKG